MDYTEYINLAMKNVSNSYSPYSKFQVSAVLVSYDGKVFTGCNIENISYSMTICAERTAFFKGISEGAKRFRFMVLMAKKEDGVFEFCMPCGACRQVMSEFCDDEFEIVTAVSPDDYKVYHLKELFPEKFVFGN